jgi:outer membrane protein assembly factor BamB
MRMSRASFVAALVLVILAPLPARGDWPSARHDPVRTGVSPAMSDLANPAVYWKAFTGGALNPSSLLVADVDLDGQQELVYVAGGSVVAVHASGEVVWHTPPQGFLGLYAIDDFDGDKLPDVLVSGASQAFLLRGKDGSVEWTEDAGDFGTLGGLRVTDLNSDGRPDLVAEECHCCAVLNGASGFAYTFAPSNGAIASTRLWAYPPMGGDFISCGVPTVVFDPTGNGSPALAHAGNSSMWVIASDGTVLVDNTRSPAIGVGLYNSDCIPADVDGTPGQELVCFQTVSYSVNPTPLEPFVLHYNATSPPTLTLLWQNTTIAQTGLAFAPNAVVDLDGNGSQEVVVAGQANGTWTTYVLDAASGATLATIPNQRTVGTAPVRKDGKVNILTADAMNQTLTVWLFDPTQQPSIQQSWSEASRQSLFRVDSALLRTQRANQQLMTPDLDGDGVPDLLAAPIPPATALYNYSAPTGTPSVTATFTFPNFSNLTASWLVPPTTASYPQVAAASTDGFLRVFDDKLTAGASIPVGGFCPGGFHNSPVVASFGGANAAQSVLVTDSRGALLRFDAQNASLAGPPQPTWSRLNCASPSIVPSLDGANPGVVCRASQQTASQSTLFALRGDSTLLWSAPVNGHIVDDSLPGSPAASGAPTIFFQMEDSSSNASVVALDGHSGSQLWASPPVALISGLMPHSVADWNGDGVADVVSVLNTLQALSGASGQTIVAGTTFLAYGIPILQDVNNDGVLEATVQANPYSARTVQHDLQTPIWVGATTNPLPAGSIVACSGAPQLLEGGLANPARLYFTQVAGATAGTSTFTVLAGGKQYADESHATAAGAFLGQLSDVVVGNQITGSANPTAIVGSTDGWVYALDACQGTLKFSVPLGEAVCGAVLGDTNADGRDEILVSTSGGYVYDIQNQELASPAPVIDTDPPHGITNKEVSTIVTQSTLYGAWQAVPGATGYQVAIVHEPQGIISSPAWQDAGTSTSGSVTGLPLTVGQTYKFAVHAVGPQGKSVDALSPGVEVIAGGSDGGVMDSGTEAGRGDAGDAGLPSESGADGGEGPSGSTGGCGCRTVSATTGRYEAYLAVCAMIAAARLRRRTRRR